MIDIQPFIEYLQKEKRSSLNTVTAYKHDLEQFANFLAEKLEIHELSEVGLGEIRTWIITLLEDERDSGRTVRRKISALKAFYRHAIKTGVVASNPMVGIQSPAMQKRVPVYVDISDMEKLFSSELFADSFEGLRDRVIIELFYGTGMRLSELLNIRRQDVDLQQRTVLVLGKRDKERIIPFGENLHDLFTAYFEYYREKHVPDNENYYIFVGGNGEKMYAKAIYRIVRKYLDMVTTIDKRSPHVIRHTFATHLLNNGADLNAIKEILGHSSLAATQVYTHSSMEQLKSIYKQAHPRA